MRRTVVLGLLVAGLLLAPVAAAAAPGLGGGGLAGVASDAGGAPGDFADALGEGGAGQDDAGDGSADEDVAPGERVAGAIGAERAEFAGEVGERSFGAALAAAETNGSAATVVADRIDRIEARLDALEERNASLAAERRNDSVSVGGYAARVAAVEAERASLARQLNATETAAERLPDDVLAERGVDADAIERLRGRASDLGGRQVRELARSIAGPGVGNGVGPGDREPGAIPGFDGEFPGDRGPEEGGPGEGRPDDDPGDGADDRGGTDDGESDDDTDRDDRDGETDGDGTEGDADDPAGSGNDTDAAG